MKKLLFGMLLAGIAVACVGSTVLNGSGKAAKGEFDISSNYTELSVSNGITVEFVSALVGQGTIVADEMVMDYVSITENNGKVRVKYDPEVSLRSKIETVVSIPLSHSMTAIKASSASMVKSDTPISANSLDIEVSSAAKVELEIEARDLSVNASSAADCCIHAAVAGTCRISGSSAAKVRANISAHELYADLSSSAGLNIEGTAEYCKAEASSAGGFDGYDLVCQKADAGASSAGSIRITVTDELGANVSSGANVKYKGSPRMTSQSATSGGSIKKVD